MEQTQAGTVVPRERGKLELGGVKRSAKPMYLRVSQLEVDPVTQRDLKPGWVAELVSEFDPDYFGELYVSHRRDSYLVIDGQHRVEALRKMGWGDQMVPCMVFEGLTLADEAEAYLMLGHRRGSTPYDRFRMGVVAEWEEETQIVKIATSLGLKIHDQRAPNTLLAVESLRRLYRGAGIAKRNTPEVLTRTLLLLKNAWNGGLGSFEGPLILGLGLVLIRYGKIIDTKILSEKFQRFEGGAAGVIGRAKLAAEVKRRPLAQCVASVIVDAYNHRRPKNKLQDWWSAR